MGIIPMASDHAGFELKEYLREKLTEKGYQIKDMGTYSADSVDYPDMIHPLAKAINDGEYECGIIMCGSGEGVSMTANKYSGVRCALCSEPLSAKMTRLHNDANVLAMGAGIVGTNMAYEIVDTFLNTEFSGDERHQRRIDLIEA